MITQCLSFPHGEMATGVVIPGMSSPRNGSKLLWAAVAPYLRDVHEGISFSKLLHAGLFEIVSL